MRQGAMFENDQSSEIGDTLHALKRRFYLWAVACGLAAILLSWILQAANATITLYSQITFPILTAICLGLLIGLWKRSVPLAWVELTLFTAIALALLGRLYDILYITGRAVDPDRQIAFTELLYRIPFVYVLAFLMFESRRRLLLGSLVFFAASAILGLTYGFQELRSRSDATDIYLLSRFFLANAGYIILLLVSVRLNEQYVRARTLAESMTRLAYTDPLVPIANRRELELTIAREIQRATRHHQPLSIILFDLDHFKKVNDRYGHDAGDRMLIGVCQDVRRIVRLPDILGRWGGEEFLIVAPQTDLTQAMQIAERARQAIADHAHEHMGPITASFGVAEYHPDESAQNWLKRVDAALYAAKAAGRNRSVMA
jgi:diguanylate cyclase